MIRRRLHTLLIGRLLGGDPRRWALYFGGLATLRFARRVLRGEPEVVYSGQLPLGQRLQVLSEPPAPASARSKRARKALERQARAELSS